MENEKRLIDANALLKWLEECTDEKDWIVSQYNADWIWSMLDSAPTVDAVEVPDNKLLRAINLLIKQYEHSKNSEYVHHPIAHAFFHTWKQLDGRRE